MSSSYSEKAHPSAINTRFNTRYVIPLFSYTDTIFEWSQMEIIKLEFPIFWYETFFMYKTSLLLLNFCLCVYTCKVQYIKFGWRGWTGGRPLPSLFGASKLYPFSLPPFSPIFSTLPPPPFLLPPPAPSSPTSSSLFPYPPCRVIYL